MKYKGQRPGLNIVEVFLPRASGDLRIVCMPVMSYAEFDALVKPPVAPIKELKGGAKEFVLDDPTYQLQVTQYAQQKTAWLILKSLDVAHNPEMEWETVKMDKPKTWPKWAEELAESGLSEFEIKRIEAGVYDANSLNEARVEVARKNFQRTKAAGSDNTSGLQTELNSTQSGTPAS